MGLKEKVASIRRILGGVTHTPTIKKTDELLPTIASALLDRHTDTFSQEVLLPAKTLHSKYHA